MWFATLSCEWTRKANWRPKLGRLAYDGAARDDAGDEYDGKGDEADMAAGVTPRQQRRRKEARGWASPGSLGGSLGQAGGRKVL